MFDLFPAEATIFAKILDASNAPWSFRPMGWIFRQNTTSCSKHTSLVTNLIYLLIIFDHLPKSLQYDMILFFPTPCFLLSRHILNWTPRSTTRHSNRRPTSIRPSQVTFWKNVSGVYTADPRQVPEAFPIDSGPAALSVRCQICCCCCCWKCLSNFTIIQFNTLHDR